MGMIASFISASDRSIDALANLQEKEWWLTGSPLKAVTSERHRPDVLERIFGGRNEERDRVLYEFPDGGMEGRTVDLDKAWHGIHFLLTGEVWAGDNPKSFLITGGQMILKDPPTRSFTSAETRQISDALSDYTIESLRAGYRPEDFKENDIYPALDWRSSDFDEYVLPYFKDLQEFLKVCVRDECGFLLMLG
ncbi:MAG: hypothetical protein CMK07_11370 [Ponticaulis sp.]|nr:hypothetical protein [Ponticaulis sp.]